MEEEKTASEETLVEPELEPKVILPDPEETVIPDRYLYVL